jgi:hypothetical protein
LKSFLDHDYTKREKADLTALSRPWDTEQSLGSLNPSNNKSRYNGAPPLPSISKNAPPKAR